MTAEFSIVKDPRLSTTPEAYRQQFELLQALTASLGKVHSTVNDIRRIKSRLAVLADGSGSATDDLGAMATAATEKLHAVEAVLVDVHRESPRDVLRHAAGLNDTLADVISTVSIADTAPTSQAAAVAAEIMQRAELEIAKIERLTQTEIAEITRLALEREVAAAATTPRE